MISDEQGKHPPLRGWLTVPLIGSDSKNYGLIQVSDRYEREFIEGDKVIPLYPCLGSFLGTSNTSIAYSRPKSRYGWSWSKSITSSRVSA